jgi:hypothetical protein
MSKRLVAFVVVEFGGGKPVASPPLDMLKTLAQATEFLLHYYISSCVTLSWLSACDLSFSNVPHSVLFNCHIQHTRLGGLLCTVMSLVALLFLILPAVRVEILVAEVSVPF